MSYFDKFTINLQKAIKVSSDAAKHFGSSYIGSEHIPVSYTHLDVYKRQCS